MKRSFSVTAALVATFALGASAASSIPTCGGGTNCPASTPCCSQYGQCGVGAYCLGGCDPQNSFDLTSCVAAPVCKSGDYKLNSLDDVQANTDYLGDSTQANWVSSGTPVVYNNNSVLLTMAPNTVGTLLSSTHYVWYGKISATMTSSQGTGVVTAFIMMSDMKDEIDFEFVGTNVEQVQSNYYFQGITDYGNGVDLSVSNTVQNTHTYTVDWNPDVLTWAIDGNVTRTLKRSDTYNTTTKQYHYPQSPSRIQLSLWPAGLASNGEGTIEWAGGLVNWNSPYMANGYYYAMVNDVSVECYDPPSGFSNNHGSNAYYYTSTYGTNDTVAIGNNKTTLASFYATGDNPNVNPNAVVSGTTSSATSSATPQTVPGVSGGGARGDGSVSSGSSSDSSGSSVSSAASGQSTASSGFVQGTSSTGSSGASKVVAGSAVALLGFFVAAVMM